MPATEMDLVETKQQKREKRPKVQFDLTPEAEQELDELQRKSHSTTRVETIRRALLFYGWLIHDVNSDYTIQVLNKEEKVITSFPARLLKGATKTD